MTASLGRRLWMALLTGVPFAIYKFGFGWFEYNQEHFVLGTVAMIWGGVDFMINLLAVFFPDKISWCLLSNIGKWIGRLFGRTFWQEILLAVDTTASFLIVSYMIWFEHLPLEPELVAHIWNLAVICNILAVGIEQLYRAASDRQTTIESAE